jgi:hypothetical protein
MEKLFWLFRRIWSVLWLGGGVLLLAALTSTFMTAFVLPTFAALAMGRAGGYVKEVWLAFDVFWNIILLGDRWETFSSRLGKIYWHGAPSKMPKWFVHRLVWMLDKVDTDHCKKSVDWKHGWTK